MEKKLAYKFELDKSTKIVLLYDKPKTGQGQYGEWYLYGAEINQEQTTFFATEKLHEEIQRVGFKKGSVFTITLKAGKNEEGKLYQYYEIDSDGTPIKKFANSLDSQKAIEKKDNQDAIWEAKDRLSAAQTALNCASDVFQGSQKPSSLVVKQAKHYYDWLIACKNNIEDLMESNENN